MVIPYRLAFVKIDGASEDLSWIITNMLIDLIFIIDMIISFRTAYIDTESDEIITSPKKIAIRYLKFWFWIDFLAINPIEVVIFISPGEFNLGPFEALRLLRMSRVIIMFQNLLNFKGCGELREGDNCIGKFVRLIIFAPGVDHLIIIGLMV